MVFPAGVRDQYLGIGVELFKKVSADFEAAGAANGLHGGHTAGFDRLAVRAKHQRLDACIVSGDAVNGQITTWFGGFHHGLFSRLHAGQQRQLAVVIVINAYAQIDLGGVAVRIELFVQTQNRVAEGHFDV